MDHVVKLSPAALRFIPSLVMGFLLIALTSFHLPADKINHPSILPPKDLPQFTFGHRDTFADSFWIRTIQDMDYCENGPALPVPTNTSQEKLIHGQQEWAPPSCHTGWVYHMLDTVTELAPRFKTPYISGALTLSVIVADRQGATLLFEKGLKQFPNDGRLAFYAAYHMLYEEANPKRAAELLIQAGKNGGAPAWVFSLASRILQKDGQVELARLILEDALATEPPGPVRERLIERLNSVNAQ